MALPVDFAKTETISNGSFLGSFARVVQTFNVIRSNFATARSNQKAIRDLQLMSDRELSDIGISRHQIVDAVLGRLGEQRR